VLTGADIRSTRRRLNLTQRGLAQVVGVHHMTVSKWERHQLTPTRWMVSMLCALRLTSLSMPASARAKVPDLLVYQGPIAVLGLLLPTPNPPITTKEPTP
jgi:DNA-binding XRE family transcriptional regulator